MQVKDIEMIRKINSWVRAEAGLSRLLNQFLFKVNQKAYVKNETSGNGGKCDFAHVTCYVATNAGDTVLSHCVRRTLQSAFKLKKWKLIPVKQVVSDELIASINQCEKLIIGGGGLFLPDTNENSISGWQWAISPENIGRITSQICVFSVGYNYFYGQEPDELFIRSIRTLIEKSAFFGLRNMGSVAAVRALLPSEMQSKVIFQPCTTTLIRKLYEGVLPERKDTKCIALNMAFDREERRYGKNKEKILSQVAQAMRKIQSKGYKLYYVCHCKDDDKFLPYLKNFHVQYKLVDLSRQYPDKVMKFYNKMDLVLGMRGHAQMIPFGVNCEIISLGTHDKMKWFLEDIDAVDWYIDLRENPDKLSEEITEKFVEIHETKRNDTKQRLTKAQDELWQVTIHNMEIIKESY